MEITNNSNYYGYPKNKMWYAVEFSLHNPTSSPYSIDLFNGYSFTNIPTNSIDASNISVISNVPVSTNPSYIVFNPSNNMTYSCNEGSNNVSVIDCSTNSVVATIPVGTLPQRLVLNTINNTIYVCNFNSDNISVIDCATNTFISNIAVGTAPSGISFNSINNTIYVCNFNSDNISVIDCNANTVSATISVGNNPSFIVFNETENRMYFINQSDGDVSIINCLTNLVISTISVAAFPSVAENLVFNSLRNKIYVLVSNSNLVEVIDCISNTITDTILFPLINGVLISYNAFSDLLYVGGISDLFIVNCSNNSILSTVSVGTTPFSVAYSQIDNYLYVSNFSSGNVSVIYCATNTVIYTVTVGTSPAIICYNSVNGNLYITNYASDTVSVLGNNANFYITGTSNYNQFVRELQNTPKRVRHIRLKTETYSQMAVPMYLLRRDANGNFCGVPRIPTEDLRPEDYQSFMCEMPFSPKELILNNNEIISGYTVAPESVVKMTLYYDEIDMSDLLSEKLNVYNQIETKVEDLNTISELTLERRYETRLSVKPSWLKNFKSGKVIKI